MLKSAKVLFIVGCLAVIPSAAYAQGSSITGTVKDASGAVLPGVTVEAASPVLIEKVKSAVSDGNGLYRIIDLRPGTYTVTFTLTGFSTVKREGFELPADFVSTLNVDLKVGALEETVTVTGESPIVDVQTTRQQRTLDNELLRNIPTARGYAAVMLLIPSMVVSGGGNSNVQLSPGMIVFGGRGGRGNEGQSQLDGLGTGAAINGGGVSGYGQLETAQEVVMTTAGGLGEAEVGGPIINFIPKTGGNTFQHHFYGSGMKGWMQSDNYSQITKDFSNVAVLSPQKTLYLWDTSLSSGGPIKKDRLWFFYTTAYGKRHLAARHVLQQERRRHHQVDLRAGLRPSGRERQCPGHDPADAAPDGAGHVARQAEHVLGSEHVQVQRQRRDRRYHRPGRGGALRPVRSRRNRVEARDLRPSGTDPVDVHDDEPAAAGGGPRDLPTELERPRAAGQQSRSDSGDRAVHGRVPQQRQPPEPELSRAELEHGFHGADPVERVGDLCHRRQ